MLYRVVDSTELISVTAKVTNQTRGNWSLGGVMVRQPNPVGDGATNTEDWYGSFSFVTVGTTQHQRNRVLNGAEDEDNNAGLLVEDMAYLRIEKVDNAGRFAAFRSADGETWIPHSFNDTDIPGSTNISLQGTLQVGIAYGGIGAIPSAVMQFDWVEIEVLSADTDCQLGIECVWNLDGSGDFNAPGNWALTSSAPNANTVTAIFGNALTDPVATVFTNTNVTVKELRFDNTNSSQYVLAGAGQITLEADTGSALINVANGSHQIQVPLSLESNVTASAVGGASLDINAPVTLNGNTLTNSSPGQIRLNNGTIAAGSGAGAVVNEGALVGLARLEGDLSQSEAGSLGVVVGAAPIQVTGSAVLDGVLDVSLADGFNPVNGQTYTVLTAGSVSDLGLSLGGDAAALFRLAVGTGTVGLTAIPEPASAALACLSCAMAAILARRRR
jgi:hypothetical protein